MRVLLFVALVLRVAVTAFEGQAIGLVPRAERGDDFRAGRGEVAERCSWRMRSCAVVSTIGRSSAKLRRSPLTLYCLAGNVTLRPGPPRRSQTENPINFRPASGPFVKCSSASASLPGGFPLSLGVILIV